MAQQAPLTRTLQQFVQPVATAGNDLLTIVGVAPFAGTVTEVTYTPVATKAGADTNTRTLTLYNRGQAGTGTTVVAQLALTSGVDLTDNDEKAITLSGTAANLVLAAGDTLEWESLHVSSGITDPGGLVKVKVSRTP